MLHTLTTSKSRKKAILFYLVVFVGGWELWGWGLGLIFDLLFKITMKKGDNLFCVFACQAARHYFFSFNAFMVEREDVISPADKKKSTTTMPHLILSLKNNNNNKQTMSEKKYNRVLSLTTLAGPFIVSSLTSTKGCQLYIGDLRSLEKSFS